MIKNFCWISCEDKLPPYNIAVLTYDPYGSKEGLIQQKKRLRGREQYWGKYSRYTHWAPLPPPPPSDPDIFEDHFWCPQSEIDEAVDTV